MDRLKAAKEESKAREMYTEEMQKHTSKNNSLNQKFEVSYRSAGVKTEHYHVGKFNGVNCFWIMEKSNDIILGSGMMLLASFKSVYSPRLLRLRKRRSKQTADSTLDYLVLLDAWSKVRGIDHGLLPTSAHRDSLVDALHEVKIMWLAMYFSTPQPKRHLTVDGHLLDQFTRYGGLADKSDESIEKGHQILKSLRERFRGISFYKQRETCIRRELWRRRSPEIQLCVDNYEAMIKQSSATKRSIETEERQDSIEKAKQEKRDNYIIAR